MADECPNMGVAEAASLPAESAHERWNAKRMALFLDHLAEYCNVRAALAHSGMASTSLYRKRRECARFRAEWDAALEQGYSRLEAELLDRALNGEKQEAVNPNGEVITLRKVSSALGLALLRFHSTRVAAIRALHGTDHDDHAMAAKIAIIKKLDNLARHGAKKEKGAARGGGAG